MLQVIYPTQVALTSPCGPGCSMFATAYFPECCVDCLPVNQFLLAMGDVPHCRPANKNLHELFPVNKSKQRAKRELSSREDCAAASKKIQKIKKKTRWTNQQIGDLFGIDQSTINFMLHDRRKRMDIEKCRKIMEFKI